MKLENDRKVGKIEGDIQTLYDRLDKMERENAELRALVERLSFDRHSKHQA